MFSLTTYLNGDTTLNYISLNSVNEVVVSVTDYL